MKTADAKSLILEKMKTNDAFLADAILTLYARQELDEQMSSSTVHENGVGFNGFDAPIMSSFAKQIAIRGKGTSENESPLSPKQLFVARKIMKKYASQLTNYLHIDLPKKPSVQMMMPGF